MMISFYNLIIEQRSIVSFLLIILSWLVYAFVLWRLFENNAKKSFDFSVIGVLVALMINRFLYVIFHAENFTSNYWSVYPYSWKEGYRILFNTKPWIIFAFWRGGFDLRIFLISFLFSIFIINSFYKEHVIRLFNNILKAFISSYLLLLILMYYSSLCIGKETPQFWGVKFIDIEKRRHPLQGYIFAIAVLAIIPIFLIQKRIKWLKKINGFVWGFVLFLANALIMYYYGENIPMFIITWSIIVALLIFVIIVIVLLGKVINYKDIINIGKRTERVARKQRRQRRKKKFGDFSGIV